MERLKKFIKGSASEEDLIKAAGKDEEEFLVDEIIRHKFGNKKPIKFRIRWKNFGKEDDSWQDYSEIKELEA
ncbi:hypothetical protein ADUPG1_004196, partial [Aduncisulcus paluster]